MFCLRLFFGFSTKFHQHKRLEVPFRSNKTNSYFSHLAFSNLHFPVLKFLVQLSSKTNIHSRTLLVLFMDWKLKSFKSFWSLMHPANSVESFCFVDKKRWNFFVTILIYKYINLESSRLVLCINWKVERESPFEVWCVPRRAASCKFHAKFLA